MGPSGHSGAQTELASRLLRALVAFLTLIRSELFVSQQAHKHDAYLVLTCKLIWPFPSWPTSCRGHDSPRGLLSVYQHPALAGVGYGSTKKILFSQLASNFGPNL